MIQVSKTNSSVLTGVHGQLTFHHGLLTLEQQLDRNFKREATSPCSEDVFLPPAQTCRKSAAAVWRNDGRFLVTGEDCEFPECHQSVADS